MSKDMKGDFLGLSWLPGLETEAAQVGPSRDRDVKIVWV